MQLVKILKISGKIRLLSGLHIGGNTDVIEIGGIDNPVIKNPLNQEPYIPGSSIKGKMRSCLELSLGKINDKGEPCGCGKDDCLVCRTFGPHKNTKHHLGPTRLIVRDAYLSKESKELIENITETGRNFLEEKTENSVNRKSGTANNPRFQERVPEGMIFDFQMVLNIFDNDDEKELLYFVYNGLEKIEDSYLGGSGSRGNGHVRFEKLKVNDEEIDNFRKW